MIGSYEISTFAACPTAELHRLNAQVDLFWPRELALYQKLGFASASSALDCGCGPGYLLEKLHAAFPHVQLTGIDADPANQILSAHSQSLGVDPFLRAEGCGIPAQLVKNGFLTPDTLDRVIAEWHAMIAHPDRAIFRMLFASWGAKPASENSLPAAPANNRLLSSRLHAPSSIPASPDDIRLFLRQTLATELNLDPESLLFHEPLVQQGVDSLAAVTLSNQVQNRYSATLAPSDILGGKSINDLTTQILQNSKTPQPKISPPIPTLPRLSST